VIWRAIVILVSLGIAFVVIGRFTVQLADERAERERQRNVEEAIKAKRLSDVAKRLRPAYTLDEKPSAVNPPLDLTGQPKS
jgi:hypothetical protein